MSPTRRADRAGTVTGTTTGFRLGPIGWTVVVVIVLAALSLLLRTAVTYDAWAWMVWGREVRRLDLDTTGGPSWKPLPVVALVPLSLLGSRTPAAWLLVARAGGLMAFPGAYRLAARSAGALAGVSAAVLLLLTPDPGARFLRLLAEGHTAPLEAALWLWAIERHLSGRHGPALALGTGLALLRPEAWPFLAGYCIWLWRREPERRPAVCVVGVLVPLLWFGGDWWGSGDPWHGAGVAQVASGGSTGLSSSLEQVAQMVVVPVWLAAGLAVALAWSRREWVTVGLAGLAVGWAAVVTGMATVFGFAALSRFLLPAAALVCVLAGIGIAALVDACASRLTGALAYGALALLVVASAWPAVRGVGSGSEDVRARARLERDLDAAVSDAGGTPVVTSCGRVAVDHSGLANAALPALAWKLDLPLGAVESALDGELAPPRTGTDPGAVVLVPQGGTGDATLASAGGGVRPLGASRDWVVYTIGCDPATGA